MNLDGDFLDKQRMIADPPADALIAEVVAADASATTLELIRQVVRTGGVAHPKLAENWRVLCDTEELGELDWEAIERAEAVFRRWGPQIVVSLCFGSLAGGYAATHIAHMLLGVSRLESDPRRRVFETAQLLFDVLGPGGLKPGGRGRQTAERVRLMHASVRHLISEYTASQEGLELRAPNGDLVWDLSWGAPINQEIMAGTMLTLSVQVLDCLATQGARLSPADQWAYVYTWFVVARLMGVGHDLVPETLEDARRFWDVTKERQFRASPAAAELEQHLLDAMEGLIPGRGLRYVPRAIVWWLNDPEVARMVGVQPLRWHERIGFGFWKGAERAVAWLEVRNAFVRRRLGSAGMRAIQRLDGREMGHDRPPFSIPATLAGEWNLPASRHRR